MIAFRPFVQLPGIAVAPLATALFTHSICFASSLHQERSTYNHSQVFRCLLLQPCLAQVYSICALIHRASSDKNYSFCPFPFRLCNVPASPGQHIMKCSSSSLLFGFLSFAFFLPFLLCKVEPSAGCSCCSCLPLEQMSSLLQ